MIDNRFIDVNSLNYVLMFVGLQEDDEEDDSARAAATAESGSNSASDRVAESVPATSEEGQK